MLTIFVFVNKIGNAERCSNLKTDTVVLLHKHTHHIHHAMNTVYEWTMDQEL